MDTSVMNVVSLRPDHIDALYEIYHAQVASAPHCRFAADPTRFRDDLLGHSPALTALVDSSGGAPSLLADFLEPPQVAEILVAEEKGIPQGFATYASYSHAGENIDRQFIVGLFFATQEAGSALIRACEARATSNEFFAFPATHANTPMYTYNAAWDGLSDHVPHVARLLASHGYVPYARELHLIAPLPVDEGKKRSLPAGLTLSVPEYAPGYQGERVVHALDGDSKVGICIYSSLAFLTNDEAAAQVGYVWWLHVEEAYRRREVARAMIRAAMNQLAMAGCTSCWLTTSAVNWNAQALYYSLAFDVVDISTSFRKQLSA